MKVPDGRIDASGEVPPNTMVALLQTAAFSIGIVANVVEIACHQGGM
jgi:hypothetical protein